MLVGLDDTDSNIDQQRKPRTLMAATKGNATSTRTVCIPNHDTRSPCTDGRLKLAKEVASRLPGVLLDDTWLVYPVVKLGYNTNTGPAKLQIAVVLPSLEPPGYFRATKTVVDFLQQLHQQKVPLPGVKDQPAASADHGAAVAAVLDGLGKAFKRSSWISSKQQISQTSSRAMQQQEQSVANSSPGTAAAAAAASNAAAPRKRGRPPLNRQHQEQQRHLQPSGTSSSAAAAAAAAAAEDPPRRRPGRPPKQRQQQQQQQHTLPENMSGISTAAAAAVSAAAAAAAASVVPARKRGRPRNNQQQQQTGPEPSGTSVAAAAAAVTAGPSLPRKRKLDSQQQQQPQPGEDAELLQSTEDSSDSGAAVSSPPAAAAAAAVSPGSLEPPAAAAKRRRWSQLLQVESAAVPELPGIVKHSGQQQQQQLEKQKAAAVAVEPETIKKSDQQQQQQHSEKVKPAAVDAPATVEESGQQQQQSKQQGLAAELEVAAVVDTSSEQQQQEFGLGTSAAAAASAAAARGRRPVGRPPLPSSNSSNSSSKLPVLPHGRENDPAALAALAEQVRDAIPGWQLDELWVMSPGNSSPAVPRIDPCIMHSSIKHGYLRSNRAVLHYLTALKSAVAKIGRSVAVPGLVPLGSSKQQQQGDAAAVAAAVVEVSRKMGRGFVGFRSVGKRKSPTLAAARAAAAAQVAARPSSTTAAAAPPSATAAAAARPSTTSAAAAAAAGSSSPALGVRLSDGRVPCVTALASLQRRVAAALPGTQLDSDWVVYPGGEYSGCKLDVCVMHPSTPQGYFRTMKAVITYLTALKAAVRKLGTHVAAPGLLLPAGVQQKKQQGQQASSSAAAAAAGGGGRDEQMRLRIAAAIETAIEATGRTFVPRSRTAPNIECRIPEGAKDNERGPTKKQLLRQLLNGATITQKIGLVLSKSQQQLLQQKGKKAAAAAAAGGGGGGGSSKKLSKGATGSSSSSVSKKLASLKIASKAAAAARKGSNKISGSGSSKKGLGPKAIIAKPQSKSNKTAAAALIAKAKSKVLAAKAKSAAAAAAATAAAETLAAAPRPKANVTKPKGPIQDKPHAQPRFSWKHPPVDREWDPPAKGSAVLVLGMHFASAAAVDDCHAGMAQHRDRARLLQLQQGLGYEVYSFDRDNSEAQAEGGFHIQGNFNSTRGARDVTLRFPDVKFSAVFLDYFRMPTGYALEIYKQQLFTHFVPELIRLGAAGLCVPVYVPNNTVLLTKLAKEGAFQGYADFVAMPGDCYPLYQASELSAAKGLLQGAYSNASEVRSLCEGSEFVVMHCLMSTPANGN